MKGCFFAIEMKNVENVLQRKEETCVSAGLAISS